jgi:hypothetical protein
MICPVADVGSSAECFVLFSHKSIPSEEAIFFYNFRFENADLEVL